MKRALAGIAAVLALPAPAAAVGLERVGSFASPVHVATPPADAQNVFVVERRGRIRVAGKPDPFLNIRPKVKSSYEQGLLSMVFAPDYAQSRRFYLYYSDRGGDIRIEEYRASATDPLRADAASARIVMKIEHSRYPNHFGSSMQFGRDGLLYVSTGDGGGAGNPLGTAQRGSSPLGKILRIDPRGRRREVFAKGLRNPWRFSFDRHTGDAIIGDVGQDRVEEINFVPRGALRGSNFGWRVFEGRRRFGAGGSAPGHDPPAIQHSHSAGWCSIIGGYVVRDPALPGLGGRYLYGDFCKDRIWSARLSRAGAAEVQETSLVVPGLASFGEDASGRIYAVSLEGPVYRLVP